MLPIFLGMPGSSSAIDVTLAGFGVPGPAALMLSSSAFLVAPEEIHGQGAHSFVTKDDIEEHIPERRVGSIIRCTRCAAAAGECAGSRGWLKPV